MVSRIRIPWAAIRSTTVPIVLATALMLLCSGCTTIGVSAYMSDLSPVVPPRGFFYTHFSAPLVLPSETANLTSTINNKSRDVIYVKLPFVSADFAGGRADIEDAARRAGLKQMIYADYEYVNVLGYVRTFNVRAYGYKEAN